MGQVLMVEDQRKLIKVTLLKMAEVKVVIKGETKVGIGVN
jgi:hypothetical protein